MHPYVMCGGGGGEVGLALVSDLIVFLVNNPQFLQLESPTRCLLRVVSMVVEGELDCIGFKLII